MRPLIMLVIVIMVINVLSGCASVTLYENREGVSNEHNRWQTGILGATQDDIVSRRNDGSCIRITWNKIAQLFIPFIGTKVYDEKPCTQ